MPLPWLLLFVSSFKWIFGEFYSLSLYLSLSLSIYLPLLLLLLLLKDSNDFEKKLPKASTAAPPSSSALCVVLVLAMSLFWNLESGVSVSIQICTTSSVFRPLKQLRRSTDSRQLRASSLRRFRMDSIPFFFILFFVASVIFSRLVVATTLQSGCQQHPPPTNSNRRNKTI